MFAVTPSQSAGGFNKAWTEEQPMEVQNGCSKDYHFSDAGCHYSMLEL